MESVTGRVFAIGDVGGRDGLSLLAQVDRWESRIRRSLLVAHAGPAVFGLGAVAASGSSRGIDLTAWGATVAWSLFLLVAGWNRAGSGLRMTAWVVADAVLMAALAFIGTPARQVASYITIDGALYAAAFISTRLGLAVLAIVFSGTAAAGIALHANSKIPTPLQGWVLPAVLPFLGVIAFGFLRLGLDKMEAMILERDALLEQQQKLAADTAKREAVLGGVQMIDGVVGPAMEELSGLVERYASLAARTPAAKAELTWLEACRDRAVEDLAGLRELMTGGSGETLADAVDTGVLGTSLVQLHGLTVRCDVMDEVGTPMTDSISSAVTGFVREALSNAVNHAPPPYRIAATRHGDGFLSVLVADGGGGPVTRPIPGGQGLGMAALEGYAISVDGFVRRTRLNDGFAIALVVEGGAT